MVADFTVRDVLEWARTKPADERYDYDDPDNCALCQFLRETGRCATPSVGGTYWFDRRNYIAGGHPLDDDLARELIYGKTFGGLVALLEEIAPATPVAKSDWLRIDAYLTEQVNA